MRTRRLVRPYAATLAFALTAVIAGCADTEPEAENPMPADAAGEASEPEPMQESSGLVNPETANARSLQEAPHITAELAQRLVAERPYADMRDVDALLAEELDEAQREEVYALMFKPLDLNAATEEEILLIPGVGDRMAHEFDEYRPYVGIEQFRQEIGKYVDEEEVARLEQYVRIP